MFKNKKIVGITVAALLAVCLGIGAVSVLAASAAASVDNTLGASVQKDSKATTDPVSGKETYRHDQLSAEAADKGINIIGMSDLQIEASVLGIDVTGMTDAELDAAVNAAEDSDRLASMRENAAKLGIDITGMTDAQIAAALSADKRSKANLDPQAASKAASSAAVKNSTGTTDPVSQKKAYRLEQQSS